jgi:hypothetical protein
MNANTISLQSWVAIAPDYSRVLAAGETLRDLLRSVNDSNVIYLRVLPHHLSFAPVAA